MWQFIHLVMEKKKKTTPHITTASLTSLGSRIYLSTVPDFIVAATRITQKITHQYTWWMWLMATSCINNCHIHIDASLYLFYCTVFKFLWDSCFYNLYYDEWCDSIHSTKTAAAMSSPIPVPVPVCAGWMSMCLWCLDCWCWCLLLPSGRKNEQLRYYL